MKILLALFVSVWTIAELLQGVMIRNKNDPDNIQPSGAVNPIAASRQIDWSATKGVTFTIPSSGWAQCVTAACNTVTSAGAASTVAQINSAISSASANTYVLLPAGIYSLAGKIDFASKSNVALRGAGATTTNLVFTNSSSCRGFDSTVCIAAGTNPGLPAPPSSTTWTAGYAQGATSITVGSTTGISVGDMIVLDQLLDSTTDQYPDVWICSSDGNCTDEGGNAHGRTSRGQQQYAKVTNIAGNVLTITPGLYMPNWRSGQTPGVFHNGGNGQVENSGIENVTLDIRNAQLATGNSGGSGIVLLWGMNLWVKGVAIIQGTGTGGDRSLLLLYQVSASVIRDSYWDGCPVDDVDGCHSTSYGIELFSTSDILIENNIFRRQAGGITVNGATAGTVIAYNYCPDQFYVDPNFMIACTTLHEVGISHILYEGNDFTGFTSDMIHGSHSFITLFRNRLVGRDADTARTNNTGAVRTFANSRFYNVVGNVLGDNSQTFTYSGTGGDTIYGAGVDGCPSGCATITLPDTRVLSTMLIWGNYDTVNDAVRWQSSEVPSGLSKYANPVPSNQLLPNSLYLSAKPSFFGSGTWPSIGPDVTCDSNCPSGVGSHVIKNPARLCYEARTKDGNGIMTDFNAATCYP